MRLNWSCSSSENRFRSCSNDFRNIKNALAQLLLLVLVDSLISLDSNQGIRLMAKSKPALTRLVSLVRRPRLSTFASKLDKHLSPCPRARFVAINLVNAFETGSELVESSIGEGQSWKLRTQPFSNSSSHPLKSAASQSCLVSSCVGYLRGDTKALAFPLSSTRPN